MQRLSYWNHLGVEVTNISIPRSLSTLGTRTSVILANKKIVNSRFITRSVTLHSSTRAIRQPIIRLFLLTNHLTFSLLKSPCCHLHANDSFNNHLCSPIRLSSIDALPFGAGHSTWRPIHPLRPPPFFFSLFRKAFNLPHPSVSTHKSVATRLCSFAKLS